MEERLVFLGQPVLYYDLRIGDCDVDGDIVLLLPAVFIVVHLYISSH